MQMFTKEDKDGNVTYFGKIYKDRTGVTKKGEIIENPSFEIWRAKWESTKKFGVKNGVDLSVGVNKDKESMEAEDEKAEEISNNIKALLKNSSEENQKKIGKKIRDLEINIKDLINNDIEKLTEVLEFATMLK